MQPTTRDQPFCVPLFLVCPSLFVVHVSRLSRGGGVSVQAFGEQSVCLKALRQMNVRRQHGCHVFKGSLPLRDF